MSQEDIQARAPSRSNGVSNAQTFGADCFDAGQSSSPDRSSADATAEKFLREADAFLERRKNKDSTAASTTQSTISVTAQSDIISYPDGSQRKLSFDGQELKSMVSPDGVSWERQKQDGQFIDHWKSSEGKVWPGRIIVNRSTRDVSLTVNGWPQTGYRVTVNAGGDKEICQADRSRAVSYANQESAAFNSAGLMTSYRAADGTLREFDDWQLDMKTGDLQPKSIKITEGKDVSNWQQKDGIWTVDGSPSATEFRVDSKNATYQFTDTNTGLTTKLVAGRYQETNEYIGGTEYLTRDYDDGTRSIQKSDGSWLVRQNDQQRATSIKDGGVLRRFERDQLGTITGVSDPSANRSWHRDPNGNWKFNSTDRSKSPNAHTESISGELYVDARGLCVIERSDGSFRKLDKDGNQLPATKSECLRALAEKSALLSPQVKANFSEDIDMFQNRAKLSKVEIDKTLDQVTRLFSSSPSVKSPFSAVEREVIAAQLAWHLAHPFRQEQGERQTCNVTAIRGCLISETPSEFARMIADVASKGRFVTADGTIIIPPAASLKLPPAGMFPPTNGDNSWLGQISDQVMVNIFWQRQTLDSRQRPVNKGELMYEQRPPSAGDSGDRLFRVIKNTRAYELLNRDNPYPARHPNLLAGDIGDVYSQITGKNEAPRIIVNKALQKGSDQVSLVSNETDLESALTSGPWPKIVGVHTSKSPFFEDSDMGRAGGAGGRQGAWHVVVVHGYDPRSKLVGVDNSWDPERDHTAGHRQLRLKELYDATLR